MIIVVDDGVIDVEPVVVVRRWLKGIGGTLFKRKKLPSSFLDRT
jgi:hypothetical protein